MDKLSEYFDTTVDYLMGRTDDPENSDRFGLEDPAERDNPDSFLAQLYQEIEENTPASEGELKSKLRSVARLESADITPEMDKNIAAYIDFLLQQRKEENK